MSFSPIRKDLFLSLYSLKDQSTSFEFNEKTQFELINRNPRAEPPIINPGPSNTNSFMNKKKGWPLTSFDDSFERFKRCKTTELRKSSGSELAYAASMNLREEGQMASSNVVQEVALSSFRIIDGNPKSIQAFPLYTQDEALAMIMNDKLYKNQYNDIRPEFQLKGVGLYPSCNKVRETKRRC